MKHALTRESGDHNPPLSTVLLGRDARRVRTSAMTGGVDIDYAAPVVNELRPPADLPVIGVCRRPTVRRSQAMRASTRCASVPARGGAGSGSTDPRPLEAC